MLPAEADTIAYFKHLDLALTPFEVRQRGRAVTHWRLRAGPRLFQVNGRRSFPSIDALWRAWFCAQPGFEHRYGQALAFAEQSLSWTELDKWSMNVWLANPGDARRDHRLGRRIYLTYLDPNAIPRKMLAVTSARRPVVLLGMPWTTPMPTPLPASLATPAALIEDAWRLRALKTARFDTQVPALFLAALQSLLGNPEQALLDERLAPPPASAAPCRLRRL